MAGIDDFIKTNPQFKGEDPAEVAEYVFSTQFQGKNVDRSEFDEYFLGKQQGWIGKSYDAVKGAIVGDAEFPEMGNLQTIGAGNSMGVGMASIFGSDEDVARAAVENNPGSALSKDANGNPMLTTAEGQQAYINRPGWDPEDVTRIGGKILSFVGGGRLLGVGANALRGATGSAIGTGTAGRIIGVGAATAAGDAGMQKLAGRDEIDAGQVAMTGALGAGAEALAIPAAAVIKSLKNAYGRRWGDMSHAQRGQLVSQRLGTRDATPEQIARLGQLDERGGKLIDPEAMVADAEFGYQLPKSGMMPDETAAQRGAKFKQMNNEEKLRQADVGQKFRDMDDNNYKQTGQNIDALATRINKNRAPDGNANAAAQEVSDAVRSAEKTWKEAVGDAYDEASSHELQFAESWVRNLTSNITKRLDETDVIPDKTTPATQSALKYLKKESSKRLNAASATDELGLDSAGRSIKDIERHRRVVSRMYDNASTNGDRRGVQIVKKALDEQIDEAVEKGLYEGSDDALNALKNARALNTRYMKRFRSDTEAGKIVTKMLDEDITPEQVIQYTVSVNGLSKAGAANLVKHYKAAVEHTNPQAVDSLREMAFLQLVNKPTGDIKGHQALISTLNTAMRGKGQSMMSELFTARERNHLKRFVSALEKITPTGDRARTSGTAERLMRYMNTDTPVVGFIRDFIDRARVNNALRPPSAPAPRLPAAEIAGASQDEISQAIGN